MHKIKIKKITSLKTLCLTLVMLVGLLSTPQMAFAGTKCGGDQNGNHHVTTSIDLGCSGKGDPIMDMLFGIIRFLSAGVGIVVVASLIVAGIQYSASGGDPNAAQAAMKRIRSSLTALLIFIFAYAILNYILPGAVLR